MQSFEFKYLSFQLAALLTLVASNGQSLTAATATSTTTDTEAFEDFEKPDMLTRVNRSPGILPNDPSEMPNGDQADIYYDLLESDPINTSFLEDWKATK